MAHAQQRNIFYRNSYGGRTTISCLVDSMRFKPVFLLVIIHLLPRVIRDIRRVRGQGGTAGVHRSPQEGPCVYCGPWGGPAEPALGMGQVQRGATGTGDNEKGLHRAKGSSSGNIQTGKALKAVGVATVKGRRVVRGAVRKSRGFREVHAQKGG